MSWKLIYWSILVKYYTYLFNSLIPSPQAGDEATCLLCEMPVGKHAVTIMHADSE